MKEYKAGTSVVLWDLKKCTHSAICARGLPSVFQPNERPWINVNGASEEDIVKQVHQCPSGALSLKQETEEPNSAIEIVVMKNGPLRYTGKISLTDASGKTTSLNRASFCRCSRSKNQPFCDGSHKSIPPFDS